MKRKSIPWYLATITLGSIGLIAIMEGHLSISGALLMTAFGSMWAYYILD